MISQVMTNEAVTVITSNGTNFPQTSKPQPTHQSPDSLKKSLKAEIKVMTIQIFCGVMVLSLGIILASVPTSPHFTPVFSLLVKSGYPFVGALCFVISGILSVITEQNTIKPLVHSSLAMSILSVPFALVGIVILSINMAALDPALQQCELSVESKPTLDYSYFHHPEPPSRSCHTANAALMGSMSVMLICSVLELSLAVLTAVLWWKQAHSDFPGNVIFLSQNSKNKSDISTESLCNPAYEQLLTS
ncbi:membrane-spanning 4-domains subfamily A member 6A isoform X2 [Nannospalax galili]|uniref:membrane-spanning 4-domains subfamily A member 6A isoform X2 n=1 Tax=Nannospalax galili TaxID=1026970 RepID=UPI000819CC38|nr:membrane-spanning 4-domains subfamily A member 6A isoform X2 [Nannospalax galili]